MDETPKVSTINKHLAGAGAGLVIGLAVPFVIGLIIFIVYLITITGQGVLSMVGWNSPPKIEGLKTLKIGKDLIKCLNAGNMKVTSSGDRLDSTFSTWSSPLIGYFNVRRVLYDDDIAAAGITDGNNKDIDNLSINWPLLKNYIYKTSSCPHPVVNKKRLDDYSKYISVRYSIVGNNNEYVMIGSDPIDIFCYVVGGKIMLIEFSPAKENSNIKDAIIKKYGNPTSKKNKDVEIWYGEPNWIIHQKTYQIVNIKDYHKWAKSFSELLARDAYIIEKESKNVENDLINKASEDL